MSFNLDFLNKINAASDAVTNTRGGSDATILPQFYTTSTKGNCSANAWMMKALGAGSGSRLIVVEVPQVTGVPVTVEITGMSYAVGVGELSNSEILAMEFEMANPQSFATGSAELAAYEEEKALWIGMELEARGLADNGNNGALVRKTGSGYQFSSRNPWPLLNGTTDGSQFYDTIKAYGLAELNSGEIVLLTDENKSNPEIKSVAMLSRSGEPGVWVGVEETAEALENPFFVLKYSHFKEKSVKGGDSDDVEVSGDESPAPVVTPEPVVAPTPEPVVAPVVDTDFDFDTEL